MRQRFGVEIHPCTGTSEKVQQPAINHFFPVYGDRILIAALMERDWSEDPEDIKDNTFLTYGGDFRAVFKCLARDLSFDEVYGVVHSCQTNLSNGMCESVHIDVPGWTADGLKYLEARCEELHL